MKSDLALDILRDLDKGENHVAGLADELDRTSPSISRTLSGLQTLGVVDSNRDGKKVKYHITSDGVEYLDHLDTLKDQKRRVDRLEERLRSGKFVE